MSSYGRSGIGTLLGEYLGFRGATNIGAWILAGGIAYWLWVRPMQIEEARRKVSKEGDAGRG